MCRTVNTCIKFIKQVFLSNSTMFNVTSTKTAFEYCSAQKKSIIVIYCLCDKETALLFIQVLLLRF